MEAKEEKGRGRRRQQKQPWETAVELKAGQGGGGGILILGGVLLAAAIGAGTAYAARRAQRRRLPDTAKGAGRKEEEVEGFGAVGDDSANNLQRVGQIDSATDDCQDNKYISKKPDAEGTNNSFEEEVTCNQGLSVANKLDVNSPSEIILRKSDCFLGDEKEIRSTEAEFCEAQAQFEQVVEESGFAPVDGTGEAKVVLIESPIDASQNPTLEILEKSEFALVSQIEEAKEFSLTESSLELGQEEDDKEASSTVSEYGMNHRQSEQFIEESKEDDKEASSIESEYGMNHQQSEQFIEESKFASDNEDNEDEASLRNEQIDITESDVQRTAVVIETDEEIQSIKCQFSTKVCPSDPVVDEIKSTYAEETQKEEKISSSESQIEMIDHRPETSQELEFLGIKTLDEQEQEEASSEPQLHMSQLQNEQELHENMLQEEDKEILSTESEYDLNHQTEQFSEESELAYGVADDELRDNQIQPSTIQSEFSAEGCGSSEESEHDTEREIDKEEGEFSTTSEQHETEAMDEFYYTQIQPSTIQSQFSVEECQSDHVTDESESATEEEETVNEEEELSPTSEEETDCPGASSEESNTDAIWPVELIEQGKSLQVAEFKDLAHQSMTSNEIKDSVDTKGGKGVGEGEEEEEKVEESVPLTQKTIENVVEPKLISKTEKTLIMNNLFLNHRSVLFVLLLVLAVTSARLLYQLFQITLSNKQSVEEL